MVKEETNRRFMTDAEREKLGGMVELYLSSKIAGINASSQPQDILDAFGGMEGVNRLVESIKNGGRIVVRWDAVPNIDFIKGCTPLLAGHISLIGGGPRQLIKIAYFNYDLLSINFLDFWSDGVTVRVNSTRTYEFNFK